MTYYKRETGQTKETYRLIGGSHSRLLSDGTRIRIVKNDTLHLTKNELASFGDKFSMVANTATATFDDDVAQEKPKTSAPLTSENSDDQSAGTDKQADSNDSGDQGNGPDVQSFTTPNVYEAWVLAGKPDMTVPKTGNKGTQWSKKDLEAQEKLVK